YRPGDHEVAGPYGDVLRARGRVELGDRDAVAVRETRHTLPPCRVEQHAPPHHLVRELVDAVLVSAAHVDERGRIAVPHLVDEEDVRQRIPLRGGLRG